MGKTGSIEWVKVKGRKGRKLSEQRHIQDLHRDSPQVAQKGVSLRDHQKLL
jgi:hypothetical protein